MTTIALIDDHLIVRSGFAQLLSLEADFQVVAEFGSGREALAGLQDAEAAAQDYLPYDCIVIDVRSAIDLLGEITGDTVQDEIINEIFERFCIGK